MAPLISTYIARSCMRSWNRRLRMTASRSGIGLRSLEEGRRTASVLFFENGAVAEADLVIGADGVNAKTRERLFGVEKAAFIPAISLIARSFPTERLDGPCDPRLHQVVGGRAAISSSTT